jgi:hypothetical protein
MEALSAHEGNDNRRVVCVCESFSDSLCSACIFQWDFSLLALQSWHALKFSTGIKLFSTGGIQLVHWSLKGYLHTYRYTCGHMHAHMHSFTRTCATCAEMPTAFLCIWSNIYASFYSLHVVCTCRLHACDVHIFVEGKGQTRTYTQNHISSSIKKQFSGVRYSQVRYASPLWASKEKYAQHTHTHTHTNT